MITVFILFFHLTQHVTLGRHRLSVFFLQPPCAQGQKGGVWVLEVVGVACGVTVLLALPPL